MQCCFCNCTESIDHLFFECITVNYIWSLVAFVLGANHRPTSFGQYWHWIDTLLPNKKGSHMIGLASICWAIWKSRNKCCFGKKKANWISDGNYLLSEFFLKILGRSPGGTRQGRSGEWCNDAPQDGITLPRTSPRRWHRVGSSPVMPPTWRQKSAPPLVMLKWGVSLLCCLLFWTCKWVWCQQPDVRWLVLRLNWALRPSAVVPEDFVISSPKVMKFGRGPFWKNLRAQ